MKINNKIKFGLLTPAIVLVALSGYYMTAQLLNGHHGILFILSALSLVIGLLFLVTNSGLFKIIRIYTRELKNTIREKTKGMNPDDMSSDLKEIKDNIDLNTQNGTKYAYEFLHHTVQNKKQNKNNALEIEKEKSFFISSMSHEIRTPMNGIIGFIELLKNTNLNKEQKEYISVIDKSSENLLDIINKILDFSKINNKKIEIDKILFDPKERFENIIESFETKTSEKNIDFNFYFDPNIDTKLKGDEIKIAEVLTHLLNNAIKFTNRNGKINVKIQEISKDDNSDKIKFSVEDNGIGITKEQVSQIFLPFSHADTNTTKKYGGMGLGLSISQKYISLMGGKLEVNSEIGKGSTFIFTLDIEKVPNKAASLKNKFSNLLAYRYNDGKETITDEYVNDYLKYFGVNIVDFNTIDQLKEYIEKNGENYISIINTNTIDDDLLHKINKVIGDKKLIFISSPTDKYRFGQFDISENNILIKPLSLLKLESILKSLHELKETSKTNKPKTIVSSKSKFDANILVVEDNLINQKLIVNILKNIGCAVDVANNGLEGFKMRKSNSYDLIFMDIQMPVMDGIEATHKILQYEFENKQKHVPIVTLTANALQGDKERFLKEGLDEYISKPIKMSELLYILNKFISNKMTVEVTAIDKKTTKIPTIKKPQKKEPVFIGSDIKNLKQMNILIAKHSTLSAKIISSTLDSINIKNKIIQKEDLANFIDKGKYLAVFTDEDVLLPYKIKDLNNWGTTFVLAKDFLDKDFGKKIKSKIIKLHMNKDNIKDIIMNIKKGK